MSCIPILDERGIKDYDIGSWLAGYVPVATPNELARFQAAESQKFGKVSKAAGIEPE